VTRTGSANRGGWQPSNGVFGSLEALNRSIRAYEPNPWMVWLYRDDAGKRHMLDDYRKGVLYPQQSRRQNILEFPDGHCERALYPAQVAWAGCTSARAFVNAGRSSNGGHLVKFPVS